MYPLLCNYTILLVKDIAQPAIPDESKEGGKNISTSLFHTVSLQRKIFLQIIFQTYSGLFSQLAFTCSKLTIETLEQSMKNVQS